MMESSEEPDPRVNMLSNLDRKNKQNSKIHDFYIDIFNKINTATLQVRMKNSLSLIYDTC